MDKYTCIICKKQFASMNRLIRHYTICKDKLHQQYYDKIKKMSRECIDQNNLNLLKCEKHICRQCTENCCRWEKYIYDAIIAAINKQKLKLQKYLQQKQKQEQMAEKKRIAKIKQIIKSNEQQLHKNNANYVKNIAIKLVKEFYALCQLSYDNYIFDLAKIKSLLKAGYTEEEIRNAFGYMYHTGKHKLIYMQSYTIKEGKDWKNFQLQLRDPQSIPSLITRYYKNINMKVANSLIFKNTQDFWTLQNEYNLTRDQIDYIFDYMIKKHIPVFNYIKSYIPQILQEYNNCTMYIIDSKKYNSNEYYFESAINDLQDGADTLDNIINIYGQNDLFQKKIVSFLKNRNYNNSYSAIEWLYKIKAPITKEIYFLAKQITYEQKCPLYHFNNDNEVTNFKQWLKEYKNLYE